MLYSYMSILNAKGIADKTGISKYRIWRWLTSRYVTDTMTPEEKNSIVDVVESELNEIKKR